MDNPILNDPSIIQIDNPNGQSKFFSQSSASEPQASNVLSKLLDSAMAKAARESSPELEPISRSDSAKSSPAERPTEYVQPSHEKIRYTIDYLLLLRSSPDIKDMKNSPRLPDKLFWRHHVRNSKQMTNEYRDPKHKKGRKQFSTQNQHHTYNEPWERKKPDIDSLSTDKISQLLGESAEECPPEWDSADVTGSTEQVMNMGQTVEDFEKWKSHMRLEERKRAGELIEEPAEEERAERAGNAVDDFFSYVKPGESSSSEPSGSETPKSTTETKTESKPEAKSSRFSSFFGGKPAESKQQPQQLPYAQVASPAKPQQFSPYATPQYPQYASKPGQTTGPPPGFPGSPAAVQNQLQQRPGAPQSQLQGQAPPSMPMGPAMPSGQVKPTTPSGQGQPSTPTGQVPPSASGQAAAKAGPGQLPPHFQQPPFPMHPQQLQQMQQQQMLLQQQMLKRDGKEPTQNDNFFMSLMNKKEGDKLPPHIQNMPPNMPQNMQMPPGVPPPWVQMQMFQQQRGQQGPPGQQSPANQKGSQGQPRGGPQFAQQVQANQRGPHPQGQPGQPPQGQPPQGQRQQMGQPMPGQPIPGGQSRGMPQGAQGMPNLPPGMFPNGFMPPPQHMAPPPGFNGQQFPQFMAYPPGMAPPNQQSQAKR